MSAVSAQSLIHTDALAIDDCWNRIGIYGDKSCPVLPEHIHCRNCSVYSAAATRYWIAILLSKSTLSSTPRESMSARSRRDQ